MAYAVDASASTCQTECQCLNHGSLCDDVIQHKRCQRRDCDNNRPNPQAGLRGKLAAGTPPIHDAAGNSGGEDDEMQIEEGDEGRSGGNEQQQLGYDGMAP